ncbi:MAG: hypothetical protein NT133_15230 [Alphaproteobacteria bacterium]|nr:hypothetical protein [Alphaproteobacteria bacterium]
MTRWRIFLAEDDEAQAAGIMETIDRRAGEHGVQATFDWADSESAALARLTLARDRQDPTLDKFDAYIVDMMMPWSQEDDFDEPADPRVRGDGPFFAGLRVIEKIGEAGCDTPDREEPAPAAPRSPVYVSSRSPVFVYTVAARSRFPDTPKLPSCVTYLHKDDDESELAERLISELRLNR